MTTSLRNLPENFAAGVDLSASRIQKNINTINNTLNDLPEWARGGLWVKTYKTIGMAPASGSAGILVEDLSAVNPQSVVGFPFLPETNSAELTETGFGFTPIFPPPSGSDFPQNEFRHKGVYQPHVQLLPVISQPAQDGTSGGLWTWESSFHVGTEPQILDELTVALQTDSSNIFYENTFMWPSGSSYGTPDTFVDDITVSVIVDDPAQTEERLRSSVILFAKDFTVDRFLIADPLYPPTDTIEPAYRGGSCAGLMIRLKSSTALLPANCRWRICITLPDYNTLYAAYSPWGDWCWNKQAWTVTASVLKRVKGT